MSESSEEIGLASSSSGLPPPKSSACAFGTKDQVTASFMPRAASARAARKRRRCAGEMRRLVTVSSRGSGTCATLSSP